MPLMQDARQSEWPVLRKAPNAAMAFRCDDISRDTFYRWKRACKARGESGLVSSKSCPHDPKLKTLLHIEKRSFTYDGNSAWARCGLSGTWNAIAASGCHPMVPIRCFAELVPISCLETHQSTHRPGSKGTKRKCRPPRTSRSRVSLIVPI